MITSSFSWPLSWQPLSGYLRAGGNISPLLDGRSESALRACKTALVLFPRAFPNIKRLSLTNFVKPSSVFVSSTFTMYSGQKRSRDQMVVVQKKPAAKNVPFKLVRGIERTGGYYGRFSGPKAENKFFDTTLSFNIDATGEVPATGQLNLIPQGVTESTRIGRKCTIKSIQIRGQLAYVPVADTSGTDNVFIYVVLDKQCNGAAAGISDVLTGAGMKAAMINLANSERFTILKRFQCVMTSNAGVSGAYSNNLRQIEWFHKCNIPIEFSSTTGAITEIKSNNLFLLAGSGSADDETAFSGTCRLRFADQ